MGGISEETHPNHPAAAVSPERRERKVGINVIELIREKLIFKENKFNKSLIDKIIVVKNTNLKV